MLDLFRKKTFCTAVIVAAGSGQRMGGIDKIMTLLDNKPVIWYSLHAFQQNPSVQQIVLVTRQELLVELAEKCKQWGFDKVTSVVCGGEDRVASVMNGVIAASGKATHLAVHDGARPLVSQKIITETVAKSIKFGAAAPALPVKDTIKVENNGFAEKTPDRSHLRAVQTPQIFDADLLKAALKNAKDKNLTVTDDCSCVEAMGMRIYLTDGEERNLKITTPMDMDIAKMWLKKGE